MASINQQLEYLYKKNWNGFLKIQKELKIDGITDYSAPLLMYCWEEEYNNSNKKILFIGKETKKWYLGGYKLNNNSRDYNFMINKYKEFKLGLGCNKSHFWRFVWKLNKSINNTDLCYLWTNVNKFGREIVEGKPQKKVLDLENQYFNLLKEELDIVKPDVVIFLSGNSYDNDIKNKLGPTEFVQCLSGFPKEHFAQVLNKYLPNKSFRIFHPRYLCRCGQTDNYINQLISLIKK